MKIIVKEYKQPIKIKVEDLSIEQQWHIKGLVSFITPDYECSHQRTHTEIEEDESGSYRISNPVKVCDDCGSVYMVGLEYWS